MEDIVVIISSDRKRSHESIQRTLEMKEKRLLKKLLRKEGSAKVETPVVVEKMVDNSVNEISLSEFYEMQEQEILACK